MYTSVIGLLAGLWVAAAPATTEPAFQTDYVAAKAQAARDSKPMMVVIGKGANGWAQVIQDGQAGHATRDTLSASFVCVYVDTATETGASLAQRFEIPEGPALVLSDRGGRYQDYVNKGTVSDATLNQLLVNQTSAQSTSMKQDDKKPAATTTAPANPPMYYYPSNGGGCPNCRR